MARRVTVGLISSAFIAIAGSLALIGLNGFPYKYMDLNDSGFVSPREALRTLNLGIRDASVDGEECVEVFALKDGPPIKHICFEDP